MVPVVGPFLLLGVLAWVVAIGMGVGSWFGLSDWRRRWAIAGALAGLGTFEIFLYAHGGNLPVFIARPNMVFSATALLFVGSGVAAAYGTLFAPDSAVRPALDAGSAEERLWLHDAVDRLRPTRGDWGLTAVLALPALGMLHLGLNLAPAAELVVVGVAGLLGPLFGSLGLLLRKRATDRYLAELTEWDVGMTRSSSEHESAAGAGIGKGGQHAAMEP